MPKDQRKNIYRYYFKDLLIRKSGITSLSAISLCDKKYQ